ncbi:MAG: DUF1989 domain-containing protein [Thermodesulfobacteriota bacterium]
MKNTRQNKAPIDEEERKKVKPLICYPVNTLPLPDMAMYGAARKSLVLEDEVIVPPRDASTFKVKAGCFFRIISIKGPQVGDLNLWAQDDLQERFYSGKTRALHGTHLSTGDRMWSCFPFMRPMATITYDTLDWYGFDEYGAGVHDVIGTRCDPYTGKLLSGQEYHHCCHSNLIRALADEADLSLQNAETYVHDVLNVFMCTGFTHDTHQYFMKASPVRPGDFIEFFAEIDLIAGLSTCPGGDCSSEHSSDKSICYPLKVEIFRPDTDLLKGWFSPERSGYSQSHGR